MFNKIFGIGLSKTGTSSLSEALNLLGIPSIHYPDDTSTLHELRSGQFSLSVLQHYTAISDTPVVPYYPQFDKAYPGSKFILTIRDMASWLQSVEKHWATAPEFENEPSRKEFQTFIRTAVYGCVQFNAERFKYVYETHYRNVLHYFQFRPQDLLVLDICNGDGWNELCSFLNLATPYIPFPHANEWMHKLIKATSDMQAVIPPDAKCLLIDDQALGKEFTQNRNFIPFPENNGIYAGSPADSKAAIEYFNKTLQMNHPTHIVMGWPSFWWFDIYPDFIKYLEEKFERMLENDELIVYKN